MMVRDLDVERAETVVELGPGTGAFTRAILETIPSEALFFAVEANEGFAGKLSERFPDTEIVHGSAEHLKSYLQNHGREYADEILCGLPWASFSTALQTRILRGVVDALCPGGQFSTFAYIHAAWFRTAKRFRRLLETEFSSVTTTKTVWRNLPPAFVYRCKK